MGKDQKSSKKRRKDPAAKGVDPIEQGRLAFQALRELLGYNFELLDELKALIRSLDDGKSLDISSIPDEYVKNQVTVIFKNCSLIRRKDKFTYQSRDKPGRGSVMSLLEPVMDEPRSELEQAYRDALQRSVGTSGGRSGGIDGGNPDKDEQEATIATKRMRPAGPAMPTPEERIQAKSMMDAQQQMINDDGGHVGPALPDFVFEELALSSDPKIAAVGKIMAVVEQHRAKDLRGKDAKPYDPNPYVVLNVSEDVSPGEVKKAFMKLSLLLHPDKNDHPCAAAAFDAASTASKRLQDSSLRAVVHEELREMKEIEILKAAISQEDRARQWKIAKGESVETANMPATRQEWMTMVPEKGDPLSNIDLGASRSFSTRPCTAPAGPLPGQDRPPAGLAPVVEQRKRPSLMEQHARRMREGGENPSGQHRRPFDRERDLERQKPAGNVAELLKGTKGLNDRFR